MIGSVPPPEWRFVRVVGPTGHYADYPFMLDSGADIGLITGGLARRLGLDVVGDARVDNAASSAVQELVAAEIYVEGQGPYDVQMLVSQSVNALGRDMITKIGMEIPGQEW
ncbi:MAG TPA: hypothetical protein VMG99_08715 [Thermoplasmata archaeon]|nr:hypothetical protein [Thermoplasmata archaeon]